jgi:large subunit ribosomal protein L1
MAKTTKKQKKILELVKPNYLYNVAEAMNILKQCASTKFCESLDFAAVLGLDARKSDQLIRSATNLPKGTGKTVRVAVFAQGDNAVKATAAGADIVGFEDLAEKIKAGEMDFDVVIATPDAMRVVGQLGPILGPRGLMPNPKVGTVTQDVETAVRDAKSGQVRYKTDKNAIVHCSIGTVNFSPEDVIANMVALIKDLIKMKPSNAKGQYLKKIYLSTTMGPGVAIDMSSLPV